jgi:hypothetical protein
MRLSEAIRLGAMLRPQAKFHFFADGGSCALGAAFEACGALVFPRSSFMGVEGIRIFPILTALVEHPITKSIGSLWLAIVWLNNYDGWTRERIADWVETIEKEMEAAAVEAAALAESKLEQAEVAPVRG